MDNFDLILLAAGKGERMGMDKLLLPIGDESVLRRSILAFISHDRINKIILVIRRDIFDVALSIMHQFGSQKIQIAVGGKERTESVAIGLSHCDAKNVLIHDAARPFVTRELIDRVINSVEKYGSGIPIIRMTDSIRRVEGSTITGYPDRASFAFVQTPQGFNLDKIQRAYSFREGSLYTDDSELYGRFIEPPKTVDGEYSNIKITTTASYYGLNSKIGIGYDIHNLKEGLKLRLCGVDIPFSKGLVAHSDGDAPIHALIDAMLSAAGERDIGFHFPDTDKKFKDINSLILLQKVYEIYKQKNIAINNVSIIIIADEPKLNGYIEAMKNNISSILNLSTERIAISAKTSERNNPEAIESFASVIIT